MFLFNQIKKKGGGQKEGHIDLCNYQDEDVVVSSRVYVMRLGVSH